MVASLTAVARDELAAADRGASAVPTVSVVVPTRDRPDQLERCLHSLLGSDYPRYEVLVVDNAPTTGATRQVVAEATQRNPAVRYLVEPRPGASRARNAGIRAATGEILAFTDDDVVVEPSWIGTLAAEFAEPGVIAVAGLTVPLRLDSAAAVWFEAMTGFGRGEQRRTCHLRSEPPPTRLFPYTSPYGASNNLAVGSATVRRVGGFDVRLGPGTPTRGGEDLDLVTRVLLEGGTFTYQPHAVVHHEHRQSTEQLRDQMFTYGAGSTAVLTKWALAKPGLWGLLVRLALQRGHAPAPVGVASAANGPGSRPPPWVRRRLLLGYLAGPWLWVRSATARHN